jgi:hypothetical protein
MTLVPNPEYLAKTQEERNLYFAEEYTDFAAKKAAAIAPLVGSGRKNPRAPRPNRARVGRCSRAD